MKRRILILMFPYLSVLSVAYAQAPQWEWAKSGGGEGVATDKNGNVYVISSNNQYYSNYLMKFDSLGNILWSKRPTILPNSIVVSPFEHVYTHAVTTDKDDNVYVTGEYGGILTFDSTTLESKDIDYFYIVKWDSSGNLLWAIDAPSQSCESFGIVCDKDNNVYVTGYFGNDIEHPFGVVTMTFGTTILTNSFPPPDRTVYTFIVKYNSSGNVLWARQCVKGGDSLGWATAEAITLDNTGNPYITGSFIGEVIWGSVPALNSGNYSYPNFFIVKYDTSGNTVWAKTALPDTNNFYWGSDIVASGSFVYATGGSYSPIKFDSVVTTANKGMFIVKYDTSGNAIWAKNPTNSSLYNWRNDRNGIAADVCGDLYATGNFSTDTIDFGGGVILPNNNIGTEEVFVIKYNDAGTALWAKGSGSAEYDKSGKISVNNRMDVFTTGDFYGESMFYDSISLTNPQYSGSGWFLFTAKIHQSIVATAPLTLITTASSDTCMRHRGTATAVASGGNTPYTYLWLPGAYTTQTITGLAAGSYTVTVTDAYGFSSCKMAASTITDSVFVGNVGGSSNFILSTTQTNISCNGDSTGTASVTSIGGTKPFTYAWTPSGGADSSASGLAAGSYTVVVTDSTGCPNPAVITITQPNALVLTTKADSSFCGQANGTATITVSSGGASPFSYSWNNTNPVQTTNVATGLAAGTYTVIVSDANSCSRQTSVTVLSVVSTLTLTTASSGSGCGTSMNGTLSAAITGGGIAPYTYSWNTNPPQTTSSVSNLPAGTYTVLVTDAKGCTVQSVDSIAVSSQPKTLFTSVQNISCEGISVQFANTSTQASSYLWNFGDQSTSTELNPTHTFPSTGTFVVTLVAEKPPCSDTVSTDIVIGGMGATAIGTANIFTPNGDGQNDCFTLAPDTAYAIKKCLYLEVFDRWGVKMFESSGSDNYCWDGKNKKDNKQAVGGTYYYVAKLGETTIKGYVTLIR